VAGFLLLNHRFPRSVYLSVRQTETLLGDLKARYGLRGGNAAAEVLDALRALLGALTIAEILQQGLHEFLDLVQLRLNAVTEHLGRAFFGHAPEAPPAETVPAQIKQTQ
jgi:uncharacterized alpha-E superfamily protein